MTRCPHAPRYRHDCHVARVREVTLKIGFQSAQAERSLCNLGTAVRGGFPKEKKTLTGWHRDHRRRKSLVLRTSKVSSSSDIHENLADVNYKDFNLHVTR